MLRSAFVAVLAVALSPSIAAAQHCMPLPESMLAVYELTPPMHIEWPGAAELSEATMWFALTDVPEGASMQAATSFIVASPTFIERSQLMLNAGVDRTQDLFARARVNVSNAFTAMRNDPQLALYATHGTLQTLDLWTTSRALNAGQRETNPLFAGGNRSTMIAAKAAAFGLNLYIVERLAETRPRTARWVMIGANAFMSIVVANNLAVAR